MFDPRDHTTSPFWLQDEEEELWGACGPEDREDDEYTEEELRQDLESMNTPANAYSCILGAACVMPGLHYPSECHTAEDYERYNSEPDGYADPNLYCQDDRLPVCDDCGWTITSVGPDRCRCEEDRANGELP